MKIKTVLKKVDYKVSKWLTASMLLSLGEMTHFFETLGDFTLVKTGEILDESGHTSKEEFLKLYETYLLSLNNDNAIRLPSFLICFDEEDVYSLQTASGKFIQYPKKPLIQIREHKFQITSDLRVQTMVFGKESIRFGLIFSYPQIFFDNETKKIVETLKDKENPNTIAFHKIQKFVRDHTKPTPLIIEGLKKNATFRIGKSFSSDFFHNDLIKQHIGLEWK